jgi:hypothetical protein
MTIEQNIVTIISNCIESGKLKNCFEQQYLKKEDINLDDHDDLIALLSYLIKKRIFRIDEKSSLFFSLFYDDTQERLIIQQVLNPNDLGELSEIYENNLHESMLREIRDLTPTAFDNLLDEVLNDKKIPYIKNFKLNPLRTGDGGRDFECEVLISKDKDEISLNESGKWFLTKGQIKHQKDKVSISKINELAGAISDEDIQYGLFISTNGFSGPSIINMESKNKKILHLEAHHICDWMIEMNIGTTTIELNPIVDKNEQWWGEIKVAAQNS